MINLPRGHSDRTAFTLIELLVVITIVAILIATMVPALSQARYVSMKTKNAAILKQWSLGFVNYAIDNKQILPASVQIPGNGELPLCAYMGPVYGAGTGCNLMPAIDGYNLRQLSVHPFYNGPAIGTGWNLYPPSGSYTTILGGYLYFPGYDLRAWPWIATTVGSTVRLDKGRADNVMFQDFIGYYPTYMTPDMPYSVVLPSSANGNPDPAIGFFREKTPVGVYASCYDGSVRFKNFADVQFVSYSGQFYVGHTQPQ